jgi:bacillithiol biosynthesis cysteine-adding enzyme BshC
MIRFENSATPEGFRDARLQQWAWGTFEPFEPIPNLGIQSDVQPILNQVINEFKSDKREILHDVIIRQYSSLSPDLISPETRKNIELLRDTKSVTVVTGQQIHPFLGPVFVWNKIISTIQTSADINAKYPDYRAIPVFWMATEDHDFDEISAVPFLNKEYKWEYPLEQKGVPVGLLPNEGVVALIEQMQADFAHEVKWVELLEQSKVHYLNHSNLADATRSLVNEWFGEFGLVVIDPMDPALKQMGSAIFQGELSDANFELFEAQAEFLKLNRIEPPVHHRRTHLFYFDESSSHKLRKRIDYKDGIYSTLDSSVTWTQEQFQKELKLHPERFSPNVILRPAYQQAILPNVVYVAGPAEFKYWMQVPPVIESCGLSVPRLQLRLSSAWMNSGTQKKLDQIGIEVHEIFKSEQVLLDQITQSFENNFQLDGAIQDLQMKLEEIRTQLHAISYPQLKEVKKEHEEVIKKLRAASRSYKSGEWGDNELSRSISRLKQLKAAGFDSSNPWERKIFIIEIMLKSEFVWSKSVVDPSSISEFIWFTENRN